MKLCKKFMVHLACLALALSGCTTHSGTLPRSGWPAVGPPPSSSSLHKTEAARAPVHQGPRLDIAIPVFDPGLSEAAAKYAEEGVWPELRRAEANRFAYKLKLALEETEVFGAVRVTPDATATADLYILGRIEESNGETVAINVAVNDISGAEWLNKSFRHPVEAGFHKNSRNVGKDAYDPVFENIARALVEHLTRQDYSATRLKMLTDMRFGTSLAEDAFVEHLKQESGQFILASYPSDDDPMLQRTRDIRVHDQLFVDDLQDHYRTFGDEMNNSYLVWQEQSLVEIEAQRAAKRKSLLQGVGGALLIGLAIAALGASATTTSPMTSSAAAVGGVAAGVAGAAMIAKGFQTSAEAKVHRDALNELGESVDVELSPRVVAFEEKTGKLTGTAKEQFGQWRAFLKRIYEQERTPEVEL